MVVASVGQFRRSRVGVASGRSTWEQADRADGPLLVKDPDVVPNCLVDALLFRQFYIPKRNIQIKTNLYR